MISGTSGRIGAEIARQNKLSRSMERALSDMSSQKRIRVASDDPAATAQISGLRRDLSNNRTWQKNIDQGAAVAARVDSTLTQVKNGLDRALELVVQGRTASTNGVGTAATVAELHSIADDIAQQSQLKDATGRALFPDGEPIRLPIGEGVTVAATLSKAEAFGDIEAAIRAAADALELPDATERQDAAGLALDRINAAGDALDAVRAEHGVRAGRLDEQLGRLEAGALTLQEDRNGLEATDIAETMAFIQQTMLTLNASQTAFSRVNARTLFDLLG